MKNRMLPILAGLVFASAAPAMAQDARYLAANCANCHGTDGKSTGAMPRLAGMPADQLIASMNAFKAGTRPATIMHQLAKGYSDEQIATMARYFSQQK